MAKSAATHSRWTGISIVTLACLAAAAAGATTADDEQWMMTYYQHPQPDQMPARVRDLAATGALADPQHSESLAVFVGTVMAAQPATIGAWMQAWEALPAADLNTLKRAVWRSRTEAGRAWLRAHGEAALAAQPVPDLDAVDLAETGALDNLWASFFASGRREALARIVAALEFERNAGALQRAKAASTPTAAQLDEAKREAVFRAALWSLQSLMQQQAPVRQLCEQILKDGNLSEPVRAMLGKLLAGGSRPSAPARAVLMPDGKSVDVGRLDEFIAAAEPHCNRYPPQFDTERQRLTMTEATKAIFGEAQSLERRQLDLEVALKLAQVLIYGHYLDLGSGGLAKSYCDTILSAKPEHGKALLRCGIFFANTVRWQADARPLLQRALQLGQGDARYPLALLAYGDGKRDDALRLMRAYVADNADDATVKKLLQAMVDGTLKTTTK